jgi:hypothetical protein
VGYSATELDRLDTYMMALSAVSNGFKLNVIGPARKDFYDTIGSMDKLWAYKEFGSVLVSTLITRICTDSAYDSFRYPVKYNRRSRRDLCGRLQYPLHERPKDTRPQIDFQRSPRCLPRAKELLQVSSAAVPPS